MAARRRLGQARVTVPNPEELEQYDSRRSGSRAHICVEGELRSPEYESIGSKTRTHDIVASSIINLRAGQTGSAWVVARVKD